MTDITGTVYWNGTEKRIQNALIQAVPKENQAGVAPTLTDDDGDFTVTLAAGKWDLAVYHREGFTDVRELTVVDNAPQQIEVRLRAYNQHNATVGNRFLIGSVIAFVLVIVLYVILHQLYPPKQESIDSTLLSLIATTREQAASEDTTESAVSTGKVLVSRLNTLAQNENVSREDRADIADRSRRLETLLDSDDLSELDTQLVELEQLLDSIAPPRQYYWREVPARFLEIYLIALAGIFVNKIITAATFMRWERFYEAGLYLHLAHIVVAPVLTIIAVGLLSLATFQLTLTDNNTVTIDLSNPEILIIISFLLSLNPWPLWGFIQNAAERVMGRQATA